jgi:hypothetical protein
VRDRAGGVTPAAALTAALTAEWRMLVKPMPAYGLADLEAFGRMLRETPRCGPHSARIASGSSPSWRPCWQPSSGRCA